jgi:hypothetical protein
MATLKLGPRRRNVILLEQHIRYIMIHIYRSQYDTSIYLIIINIDYRGARDPRTSLLGNYRTYQMIYLLLTYIIITFHDSKSETTYILIYLASERQRASNDVFQAQP